MTQLSIPVPCSEKWSDMTAVRHDCRFCAACEKQIVDFTGKTDAEILEHLKRNNGKICGRFRQEQLNRPIRPTASSHRTDARRGGLTAAAASVAALLTAQQPAENQNVAPIYTEQNLIDRQIIGRPEVYDYLEEQDSMRTISGKVVDAETGEGLIGATVLVMGTKQGAVADIDGVFSLNLPLEMVQNQPIRLSISYTGYETFEVEVPARAKVEDISLLATGLSTGNITGEIVICRFIENPPLTRRIRKFFHRLFD